MSKSLFEEAIADARQLREAAEQNAKNAIIEAVTPRIREFIENQLVNGTTGSPDRDFLSDALTEADLDEDDDEVALDESAVKALVDLMNGSKNQSVVESDGSALSEAFASLSREEQSKILEMIQEEEDPAKKEGSADDAYEIDLDELKASIVAEISSTKTPKGENKMKKHGSKMSPEDEADLYELDEMMDDEEMREAVLKLIGTAEEKDAFEKLGLSGIEFEEEASDEEVDVEEPSEAEPEEDSDEMGSEEEAAPVQETVYEIDENMLRRELMRLREAKTRKKAAHMSSHEAARKAFGDGTLEGDALDVEVNNGSSKVKHALMKEARENRALRQQLNDYRGAVETLREQLSDLNLFNAKLLYVNKILQNKDVAPNQRRAIIEALDGASNLREAKLLYESLATSISTKNESLNESVRHTAGLASRPVTSSAARMSGAGEVDRWAVLAGLK